MKALTAAFDIGTTAVKGVLVDEGLQVRQEASAALVTHYDDGHIEQAPQDWYDAFCQISRRFSQHLASDEAITAVIMSGQMQDVILLDEAGQAAGAAILYSDGRASAQAQRLNALLGAEAMAAATGNALDGSIPLAKLLWLLEQAPQTMARAAKVVFSAKDYVIARLTGRAVTDLTTAATSGLLDITTRSWRGDYLAACGLDPALLPRLCPAHAPVGRITPEARRDCGLNGEAMVYAGIGDAGATTLASGITAPGEININLGTSGWVAAISPDTRPGVFNLIAADPKLLINVVPFLNAGSVHRWAAQVYAGGDYQRLAQLVAASAPGSGGVLCLPYLVGERYPVLDPHVRASYAGVTPQTTAADLARAALEGVAFSLRQGLEQLAITPSHISLIGGGAADPVWCRLLADILGRAVTVCPQSHTLPALTLAAIVQLAQGRLPDYAAVTALLRRQARGVIYRPDAGHVHAYAASYTRFQRLYPALKDFYAGESQ